MEHHRTGRLGFCLDLRACTAKMHAPQAMKAGGRNAEVIRNAAKLD